MTSYRATVTDSVSKSSNQRAYCRHCPCSSAAEGWSRPCAIRDCLPILLALGDKPEQVHFKQDGMRMHLKTCFETETVLPFPHCTNHSRTSHVTVNITVLSMFHEHLHNFKVCNYLEELFSLLYIYRRENSVPHTICSLYYTGK